MILFFEKDRNDTAKSLLAFEYQFSPIFHIKE